MQRGMSVAVIRVASLLRIVRMTVVMMVIMAWAMKMLRHGSPFYALHVDGAALWLLITQFDTAPAGMH
jgi:hypothetical protein